MNPILESLPVQDDLVGLWVLSAGSFRDFSENDLDATPNVAGSWRRENGVYGLHFGNPPASLDVAHTAAQSLSRGSLFVAAADKFETHTNGIMFIRKLGATGRYAFYTSGTNLILYDGTTASAFAADITGKKSVGVTFDVTTKPWFYIDTVRLGQGSLALTVPATNQALNLFGPHNLSPAPLTTPRSVAVIYDVPKSSADMAALNTWSKSLISPDIQADRRYFDFGSLTPIGDDAIAAWDFGEIQNRETVDKSGNSKTGALNGILATVETIVGRAVQNFGITNSDAGITIPALTAVDDYAVEALVYLRSDGANNAGRLFQSPTFNVFFSGTPATTIVITATGITGSSWTVNNAVPQDEWFHLVITRRRSDGAVAIYVNGDAKQDTTGGTEAFDWGGAMYLFNNSGAGAGARALDGDCKFIRFFQRYMEADEVAWRYAPIARKVMFEQTDWLPTIANLTSGIIPGTDYTISTGTWAVIEGLVEGRWRNWIQNVVAGIIWRFNPFANGSFEWEWFKSSVGAHVMDFAFVSDLPAGFGVMQDGYFLRYDHLESIALDKYIGGTLSVKAKSSNAYLVDDVNYKFRITRSTAGVFTVYVKGGTFTNWTVAVMDTIGANPFTDPATTTSKYGVFEMDPGDRLYIDRHLLGPVVP